MQRTLLSELDWLHVKKANPSVRLKKNKIAFRPYGTKLFLSILGRMKVVLRCSAGKQIKTMAYIVRGAKESLLGRRDGGALGIINICPGGQPEIVINSNLVIYVKPSSVPVAKHVTLLIISPDRDFRPPCHKKLLGTVSKILLKGQMLRQARSRRTRQGFHRKDKASTRTTKVGLKITPDFYNSNSTAMKCVF